MAQAMQTRVTGTKAEGATVETVSRTTRTEVKQDEEVTGRRFVEKRQD